MITSANPYAPYTYNATLKCDNNGLLYLSHYSANTTTSKQRVDVKKYITGLGWQDVKSDSIWVGLGAPVIGRLIFSATNVPYINYKTDLSVAQVKSFNGTTWQSVGTTGYTNSGNPTIAYNSLNELWLAYYNNGGVNFRKYIPTTNTWQLVSTMDANTPLSLYNNNKNGMMFNTQNYPVMPINFGAATLVNLVSYNGTSWNELGNDAISKGRVEKQ